MNTKENLQNILILEEIKKQKMRLFYKVKRLFASKIVSDALRLYKIIINQMFYLKSLKMSIINIKIKSGNAFHNLY